MRFSRPWAGSGAPGHSDPISFAEPHAPGRKNRWEGIESDSRLWAQGAPHVVGGGCLAAGQGVVLGHEHAYARGSVDCERAPVVLGQAVGILERDPPPVRPFAEAEMKRSGAVARRPVHKGEG